MSLLHEARRGIQEEKAKAEESIKAEKVRLLRSRELMRISPQHEQELRIRMEKGASLQSQVRDQCIELLRLHGTPSIKNPLDRAKAILNRQKRKILKTTIEEHGEEPIGITIMSEFLNPEKGGIIVEIQGIVSSLTLPKIRDRRMAGTAASLERLIEFHGVLNLVEAKLEPFKQKSN